MSVQRARGDQVGPDDWNASGMPVDTDGTPVVVIRYDDADSTVATVAEMCASMGVDADQFQDAMAGLVAAGWLQLLTDGTYSATIPDAVER